MNSFRHKQQGVALLFTSLALLLVTSSVTLYSANTIINEDKLLTKNYQSLQAFEAAEAGIEFGTAYLNQNKAAIMVNRGNNKIDGYTFSSGTLPTLPNGASFTVQYTSPAANDYTLVKITATGISNDGTATRQISVLAKQQNLLVSTSTWPLAVKGSAVLAGSIEVSNNTYNRTIRSGGSTVLLGSASTQGTTSSSNSISTQSDISSNDAAFSGSSNSSFFARYFGTTSDVIKSQANIVYSNNTSTDYSNLLNNQTNKIIWIEQSGGTAKIDGNIAVGTTAQPVILIVSLTNGASLRINGSADVYGLLYVKGNWDNHGGGSSLLSGNVIVEGSYLQGTGTPNIEYNPAAIQNLNNFSYFTKIPGSWNDIDG